MTETNNLTGFDDVTSSSVSHARLSDESIREGEREERARPTDGD